jgi:prevent-host-death family protein
MTQYSIAQARDRLTKLIHEAEIGEPVEITRRGKRVAVILSVEEYDQLTVKKPSFGEALKQMRDRIEADGIDLDPDEVFRDVRDRSPGREVEL